MTFDLELTLTFDLKWSWPLTLTLRRPWPWDDLDHEPLSCRKQKNIIICGSSSELCSNVHQLPLFLVLKFPLQYKLQQKRAALSNNNICHLEIKEWDVSFHLGCNKSNHFSQYTFLNNSVYSLTLKYLANRWSYQCGVFGYYVLYVKINNRTTVYINIMFCNWDVWTKVGSQIFFFFVITFLTFCWMALLWMKLS